MGREHSILFTMRENATPVLNSLMNSNRQFSQSMQESQRIAESYEKRQVAIATALGKAKTAQLEAKTALDAATKAWKENNSAANADAVGEATKKYNDLTAAVDSYTRVNKAAAREVSNLEAKMLRQESSMLGSNAGGGMLSQLGQAGMYKMVGDLAANAANVAVSSAFGDTAGGIFESTLSGAASGAAMGTMIGGPAGTATGAVIGGVVGLAGGALGAAGKYDEAFSGFVQDTTGQVMAEQTARLGTGSGIAGNREQDMIAFTNRLGSSEAADSFLADVRRMAVDTVYGYDDITAYSKRMINFAGTDEILSLLGTLSDTSAGLGLGSGDVDQMIQGFQMMRVNSGSNVTDRYLDYFSNRGVDVYQAIGDYLGVDKGSVAGMVTKRQISNDDAYAAIVQYMEETFSGLSDALASSYAGMVDNLADAQADMDAAYGEGYNEARKGGIQEQMDFLEGEGGQRMQDAYTKMGEYQAFLENEAERYEREMLEAVMTGAVPEGYSDTVSEKLAKLAEDYATASQTEGEEAGAMMGQALANAKALAIMAYNEGPAGQMALDSEVALAASIREDAASNRAYWDAGVRKGEEYSKGLAATIRGSGSVMYSESYLDGFGAGAAFTGPGGFAYGLNYVPYDGFPAVLHEGERVLTAGQARAVDGGSGSGVSIHIGEVKVFGADEEYARRAAQIVAEEVVTAVMLRA